MGTAIEVTDLWEGYRAKSRRGWRRKQVTWVLRGIDLTVESGTVMGIIGSNGSGKSTLLQTMAGILEPMKGTVKSHGRVVSVLDSLAGFHRQLTGRENLKVSGVLSGLRRSEVRDRYDSIVEMSGLEPATLDEPVFTYSGGMRLRLAFSMVVHCDPRVLLLDEVLAAADEEFLERAVRLMHRIADSGGAVVVVSHELEHLERECDRIGILKNGRLDLSSEPREALAQYHADISGERNVAVGR